MRRLRHADKHPAGHCDMLAPTPIPGDGAHADAG